MSDENLIRPATEDEKRDYIELKERGTRSPIDAFLKKLAEKQQEYSKLFRPFDGYSARIDFEERMVKQVGDVITTIDNTKAVSKIHVGDLDEYANPNRFIFKESTDVVEDKLLDGIRNQVLTGKYFNFKAKQRGNGISIFVPKDKIAEVESWIEDNISKKKDKAKKE